jgi:hypothetical protein
MAMQWMRRLTLLSLASLIGVACDGSDSVGPDGGAAAPVAAPVAAQTGRAERDLHFLHPDRGAPTIANPVIRFYAKKGRRSEVSMFYHRRPGRPDSTELLRFRVDDRSLYRRPNGSLVAQGDSVLITITLVDPARLIVKFQPAGLQFSPTRPARLKMRYPEANDDLSRTTEPRLRLWRQERAGGRWERQASSVSPGLDEVEGRVPGFSNFAIAY